MPVPAARGRGERARRGDPERGVRDPVSLLLRTGEPGGWPVPAGRAACPGSREASAASCWDMTAKTPLLRVS